VTLNSSETLFVVLTAVNNCGYDAELASSDPLRLAIRGEVGHNLEQSENAKGAADSICAFYRDHQQADSSHTLAQYVSLALYLTPPPALTPKVKESDLPPDATGVLGLVPLLAKFYSQAGIHAIWEQHAAAYAELANRYRDAFSKMISGTELYLRLPSGSYQGRTFTIYIEPMGAPSETNARSYATDYYVVVTPGSSAGLKIEQIRHAFLHYLLDPMVGRYASSLDRLEPLLEAVKLAPMDENFKADPALLVTECLIRSIEARTQAGGKAPLPEQERAVELSMAQGYVLTQYFYEKLLDFEKDSIGFRNALPTMLAQIDVRKESKRTAQIQFASAAAPELLHLSRPKEGKLLATAEERLTAGDAATAEKLAKEALAEKTEDPGRAFFILAQIALNGNMDAARGYFEQAVQSTSEPKVVAWSHIYLGRMLDLRDKAQGGPLRAEAVAHYQEAVNASASLPDAKAAAEQGLQKAYARPNGEPPEPPKADDDKN
jgi:tetratricopeptide (TPR) repeat protein